MEPSVLRGTLSALGHLTDIYIRKDIWAVTAPAVRVLVPRMGPGHSRYLSGTSISQPLFSTLPCTGIASLHPTCQWPEKAFTLDVQRISLEIHTFSMKLCGVLGPGLELACPVWDLWLSLCMCCESDGAVTPHSLSREASGLFRIPLHACLRPVFLIPRCLLKPVSMGWSLPGWGNLCSDLGTLVSSATQFRPAAYVIDCPTASFVIFWIKPFKVCPETVSK